MLLLETLVVIDTQPGQRAAQIAWHVAPEEAAEKAARCPAYVGWWFGGYLTKWQQMGYVRRRYSKHRGLPRFFLTNKGLELILAIGIERARVED